MTFGSVCIVTVQETIEIFVLAEIDDRVYQFSY